VFTGTKDAMLASVVFGAVLNQAENAHVPKVSAAVPATTCKARRDVIPERSYALFVRGPTVVFVMLPTYGRIA